MATGTPLGIWSIDKTESHPSIELDDLMGTPTTGSGVIEATIPGKCAAPPAPAMITFNPLSFALVAYSTIRIGVRCAEIIGSSDEAISRKIIDYKKSLNTEVLEKIQKLKDEGAEITSFKSYTGGLIAPESNDNPWGYKFTWNPRNVILAGQGTAKYIENGNYHYIPYNRLFLQTEKIAIDGLGNFEGYANRDSLSYRKHYSIENIPTLLRGTLRQDGFCSAWNAFIKLGLTDDSCIVENTGSLTYRTLLKAFLPAGNAKTTVEL